MHANEFVSNLCHAAFEDKEGVQGSRSLSAIDLMPLKNISLTTISKPQVREVFGTTKSFVSIPKWN